VKNKHKTSNIKEQVTPKHISATDNCCHPFLFLLRRSVDWTKIRGHPFISFGKFRCWFCKTLFKI